MLTYPIPALASRNQLKPIDNIETKIFLRRCCESAKENSYKTFLSVIYAPVRWARVFKSDNHFLVLSNLFN
jgi:hypothetical protein